MYPALLCILPLALVLGGSDASGQTRLDTHHGTFSKALFGLDVAVVSDLDGDTVPDFAVGSRSAAQVQYFSGSNGTLLRTVTGGSTFGRCLANLGDVDGDGFQDLLVSQVSINTVHVISGKDGSTLSTVTPPTPPTLPTPTNAPPTPHPTTAAAAAREPEH